MITTEYPISILGCRVLFSCTPARCCQQQGIGCLIKGGTMHFEYISEVLFRLQSVS